VVRHLVREQLAADADDPRIDSVCNMMASVLSTPLHPWSLSLSQVAASRVKHEWQFLLPFGHAAQAVTRQAIAGCFERAGGEAGARYAAAVRHLGVGRLHGFLTGFVDLVAEYEGRWYVVDWKSNQLGADPEAYGLEALRRVMDAHHYTLQYHLYLVALHRFLQQRVPGYRYETHMGGAGYAFLRGFAPDASVSGHGWYTDRPPQALIEALSAVMGVMPGAGSEG
jgi:exodeoxyribonuclease V beta subunit